MFNSNGISVPLVAGIDGNNAFGGDGLWGLIIILALLGGFGNGGFGFGGGNTGFREALDSQTLINKIDQQTYGMADSFTALNNTLNNNFRGIDNAICTLGYQNQQGFSSLGHQISDCCCNTQKAISDSTRTILDFLTTDKIATLQAENQNLRLRASQVEQNAYLINELKPCPTPAYVVPNPNCGCGYGYGVVTA